MLLSPEQFARLTEYASYSSHKLLDMLAEFQPEGMFYKYISEDDQGFQTINFIGFTHFINCYFGAELPVDLIQQLFLSFAQVPKQPTVVAATSHGAAAVTSTVPPYTGGHTSLDGTSITSSYVSSSSSQASAPTTLQPLPKPERRPSVFEEAFGAVKNAFQGSSNKEVTHEFPLIADENRRIPLKPLVCYLSLLEGAPPEDKLEFVFHVYDSDDNGFLDNKEIESIIEQMMNVARYQQWDTIELEPILRQMMAEIDYDNDGIVSLEEWKRGGLTTIPLLVLLGFDNEMKEDGCHIWRLRHFSKPTYCNVCCNLLVGWGGKQGLACSLCKYTVHERCVRNAQNTCIHTYNTNPSKDSIMNHHWLDSNSAAKCAKCKTTVPIFQGKRCRWCHNLLHTKCIDQWPKECDLGPLAYHTLPPVNIIPSFLDRSQSQNSNILQGNPTRFSVTNLPPNRRPLLVLINPKSGGRQGERIYRKFQYLLNPRQVYDLIKDGPDLGLHLFKSIKNANILVCGGDGTVGWVLDAMGKGICDKKKATLLSEDDKYEEEGTRKKTLAFSDKMDYGENRPPVAVLPLGTGNDLARCLKWGGGYESEPLQKILHSIEKASQVYMDRWQITIEQTKKSDKGDPQPNHIINNYFSIGVDASIAHRFHVMREKYPEKFNSRMRNKLWYFELGTSETLSSTCKNLHEQIDILCDGETIDLGNGPNLEGIALLNIASIYGGSNLWGNSRKSASGFHIPILFPQITNNAVYGLQNRVQDIGDRLIEVVGLESAIQMGQIKAGVRAAARRLSQCSTVVIQTHKPFPMQIDGEPWMQPPCIIQIIHKNQVPMLIGNRKRSTWNLLRRQTTDDS